MAKKPEKELGGPRKMSLGTKIVIGIFAVVMALSMTLPSLAPIFAGTASSSSQSSEQSSSDQESSESSTDENADAEVEDPTAGVPENETLKNLANQNKDKIVKFQKRLKNDPNDLAALLNLGQNYMSWGYSSLYSGTTDEEKAYSEGLIQKAVEYYDSYLALHASDAVKVQKALCSYYLGNTDEAIDTLKKMTEEKPDYPMGWANLGMLYEQQYDQENALNAYQKAADADPNDEYGAKTYAEQRIQSIKSAGSSFSDLTNEELLGTKSKPEEGLPGIIANKSEL